MALWGHRKLLLLCLLVWVLLLYIIFFQDPSDSRMKVINSSVQLFSTQGSTQTNINSQLIQLNSSRHTSKGLPVERKESITDQKKATKSIQVFKKSYSKTVKKVSEDWDEYFSNGRKVVHGLWMGQVSSNMLSIRLQKAKKQYIDINKYNVTFLQRQAKSLNQQELLCHLKQQAQVRALDGAEEPFASLGWRQLVPPQPLQKLYGTPYKTCAVVSSAGSILKSSLGKEIDSHDAVLRFNFAPTKGYEIDVGSKTTVRVINSKVMSDPNFHNSSLFKNCTLVVWDSTNTTDLYKWFKNPDFDLFTSYSDYRKHSPEQPIYILHPKFIRSLWSMLQENTHESIQTNPPSSGFTGIVLMMGLCEKIDIYEFIPSKRHTTLCHYYEKYRDMACTLGAYHPLLFEKLLVRRMATNFFSDIANKGKITLPGFSQITC